jgi:hypothetical protein
MQVLAPLAIGMSVFICHLVRRRILLHVVHQVTCDRSKCHGNHFTQPYWQHCAGGCSH